MNAFIALYIAVVAVVKKSNSVRMTFRVGFLAFCAMLWNINGCYLVSFQKREKGMSGFLYESKIFLSSGPYPTFSYPMFANCLHTQNYVGRECSGLRESR